LDGICAIGLFFYRKAVFLDASLARICTYPYYIDLRPIGKCVIHKSIRQYEGGISDFWYRYFYVLLIHEKTAQVIVQDAIKR